MKFLFYFLSLTFSVSTVFYFGGVYAINTTSEGYRIDTSHWGWHYATIPLFGIELYTSKLAFYIYPRTIVGYSCGKDMFIPTKTQAEYKSFVDYHPGCVSLSNKVDWNASLMEWNYNSRYIITHDSDGTKEQADSASTSWACDNDDDTYNHANGSAKVAIQYKVWWDSSASINRRYSLCCKKDCGFFTCDYFWGECGTSYFNKDKWHPLRSAYSDY